MTKENLEEKKSIDKAVDTVKQRQNDENDIYVAHNGVKLRFRPVAAYLIAEVMSELEAPIPPMVDHPNHPGDKDKMIQNPLDPNYKKQLIAHNKLRNRSALDAMFMFGIDFIDDIPEPDDSWIEKLIASGRISPQENPSEHLKRFWYVKYMISDNTIINRLSSTSSVVTQEGVERARSTFKSNKTQLSDRGSESEE